MSRRPTARVIHPSEAEAWLTNFRPFVGQHITSARISSWLNVGTRFLLAFAAAMICVAIYRNFF